MDREGFQESFPNITKWRRDSTSSSVPSFNLVFLFACFAGVFLPFQYMHVDMKYCIRIFHCRVPKIENVVKTSAEPQVLPLL